MPLVRKRQREDGEKTNEQVKRRKKCKEYTEFENIGYKNDHWHTIFRSLPDNINKVTRTIARDVGSFLNGDGGILCFGVRKTGVIYGEEINRKEEDNLRLLIDEIFKKMSPHVPTDTYRVTFTPVRGSSFNQRFNEATKLQVLEIRVAPGDPFALYEDLNHEVYLRKGDQPYGPLKPHEIKRHTVQQLTKQLKSHKDFAKLFEKPEQSEVKDKENSSVTVKNKISSSSSSGSLSPVKKPSLKSNQFSPSKSSAKVTREKSSRSLIPRLMLIPSLLSKTEQSSESAPHKTRAVPSKAETASSSGTKDHPIVLSSGESDHDTPLRHSLRSQTKEHPIVLSSGESDHEAPLPSVRPQTKTSEPKAEQPVEKPKATIKPFVIKKVTAPTVSQAKCLPGEEQVAPVKKPDSSLPPVEKVSQPTIALAKCQKVAPSKKNAAPIKPPPLMKTTVKLPKQSSVAKASTKKVISPIVGPSGIPPPPRPPPSFSIYNHLQAPRPHYYQNPYYQHPYYQHQRSYPIWRKSSAPSHSIHPLATSYSAPYYRYH